MGYASVKIHYSAPDNAWKAEWIARHLDSGVVATYGYDEYDSRFGWRLRPNLRDFRSGGQPAVISNSKGMRDGREFSFQKQNGMRRMVVLGDSFTFGQGVEQDEAWPAHLQMSLPKWEVLNMAVHGYGTDQQLLMLKHEGVKYHPDVVIVGFFVENVYRNGLAFRDFAKPMFVLENGALRLTNTPVPSPEAVLAETRGERPLSFAAHFFSRRFGRAYGSETLGPTSGDDYLLRLTRSILDEMHAAASDNSARLMVVAIPYSSFSPSLKIEGSLAEWADGCGVPTLNLRESLDRAQQETGEPMYDSHFTARGHEVAAEAVLRKLQQLGWAP